MYDISIVITVNFRLGRIGTLLVSKLSDLNETKKVTGVSPVGRSFLKLDENSELYVSGVPFGINVSIDVLFMQ